MRQEIYQLKRAVLELENNNNNKYAERNLDTIINICLNIKKTIKDTNKTLSNIELKKINSILFMYKPITKGDYLSGDYLERFSEERTSELQEASAVDIHNEFWVQHEPIKGNVFGSMPKELLNIKSIKSLEKNRWREANVNIYEILNKSYEKREVIKYCEAYFKYYILIQEKSTSTALILEYII